ncbi:MAG TPA: hypothetical protein VD962_11145 [Rubricoccaceae bacterium]|nr:hypothetical protein [Rubricoccaceae bacterium]
MNDRDDRLTVAIHTGSGEFTFFVEVKPHCLPRQGDRLQIRYPCEFDHTKAGDWFDIEVEVEQVTWTFEGRTTREVARSTAVPARLGSDRADVRLHCRVVSDDYVDQLPPLIRRMRPREEGPAMQPTG